MISWITYLKPKLLAISAFLLTIGYFFVRNQALKSSRDRWKLKAEYAQAEIEYDRKVDESDAVIEADTDARTQQIADEIEKGKPVESLSDPNRTW